MAGLLDAARAAVRTGHHLSGPYSRGACADCEHRDCHHARALATLADEIKRLGHEQDEDITDGQR